MNVHQVVTYLSNPSAVIAATASGFYLSDDHGCTFTCQSNGIVCRYQRACACFLMPIFILFLLLRGPMVVWKHNCTEAKMLEGIGNWLGAYPKK